MEDGLTIISSAVEVKHELIVQAGGEYACKTTFIVGADAVGIKVEVEVEPADDGEKKVIKVQWSYKQKQLLPVPSAEADEVAANFKVKLD